MTSLAPTPNPPSEYRIIATIAGFLTNDPAITQIGSAWDAESRNGSTQPRASLPLKGATTPTCWPVRSRCAHNSTALLSKPEAVRYFFDDAAQDDPFEDDAPVTPLPATLIRELGLSSFPPAAPGTMISFGSELFRRTVAYVGGKPAEAVLQERDRLRNPDAPLDKDDKFSDLVGKVNRDLRRLFGRDTALKFRLTSTDSDGVLEAVVPHFTELGGPVLPSRRHGNGLISLQTLILLMRFGNLRKENGENFIMAIEEPELHIPPPPQRKLYISCRDGAVQTIVTTHSPMVASVPDPNQLILLVNNGGDLSAEPLLQEPLDQAVTNVRRALFLADRTATVSAVMHPAILIPEGKTSSWLRLLARVADLTETDADVDRSAFTHDVGVIPTKDARVVDTYTELARAHPTITCLVDGDAAGKAYAAA